MAFDFDIDLGEILGNIVNQGVAIGGAVLKDQLVKSPAPAAPAVKLGVEPAVVAQPAAPPPQTPGAPIQTGYSASSIALGAAIVVGAVLAAVLGYRATR